jgi:hypothetical protein
VAAASSARSRPEGGRVHSLTESSTIQQMVTRFSVTTMSQYGTARDDASMS